MTLAMEYASYVFGAYAVTVVVLGTYVTWLLRRLRRAERVTAAARADGDATGAPPPP